MRKSFYAYAFWWLVPIVLVMIWFTDFYLDTRGLPDLRTPLAFFLVPMLFIFGFPHRDVSVLNKLSKGLVIFSKIVFWISLLIVFCLIIHMMGSDPKFPNFFTLRTTNFLVLIFLVINTFLLLKVNYEKEILNLRR